MSMIWRSANRSSWAANSSMASLWTSNLLGTKDQDEPLPRFTLTPAADRRLDVDWLRRLAGGLVGRNFLQFQVALSEDERVNGKLLFLAMNPELEPIRKECEKHFGNLRSGNAGRNGGGDIKAFGTDPFGSEDVGNVGAVSNSQIILQS